MTDSLTSGNRDRSLFGWYMYDWANSAYGTTVLAGILGPYMVEFVAPNGATVLGVNIPASSLFPFAIGVSAAFTFLIAPVLGAIADFTKAKKRMLLFFAYMGSAATVPLYFSGEGDTVRTLALFVVAQTGFVASLVFYDAFLPTLASEADMDRVSGKGYIFGYVGGGLQFLISLLVIAGRDQIGISADHAARIAMGMAGLWWAGFTLFTVRYLREDHAPAEMPPEYRHLPRLAGFAAVGFSRTWLTARKIFRSRHLLLFLVAFMFYNDGIQTVISVGAIYGQDAIGLSQTELMGTLLVVQLVAALGAFVFTRLAGRIGTRQAVLVSIAIWAGIVIYAYTMETVAEYFVMGLAIGIVLGGSQALSRSLFGSMIPPDASAEFYGFYSVFSKFSAIWGPFVFGAAGLITGSSRSAILSLIFFFLVGFVLLYFVDEKKARVTHL